MSPKLKFHDEFKALLGNYKASQASVSSLTDLKLVVITAITAAGKNTLVEELAKTGNYEFVPSDTTRKPRVINGNTEKDGTVYFFKSEDEMMNDLKAGKYLEAKLIHNQQVSGTSIDRLVSTASNHKVSVLEKNYEGAETINELLPNSNFVFLLPPSYKEWMRRLSLRGNMSQDEFINRMRSAESELMHAIEQDFYRFVVNDDLNDATAKVRQIVEEDIYDDDYHRQAKDIAWNLLNKIKQQLSS